MQPYHLSVVGLLFDIVGAFFLAAEAIKIDNLRTMRSRILHRLRHALISPPIALGTDENLTEARREQFKEAFEFGAPWGAKHPYLFTALHYVAGICVFLIANWIFNGQIVSGVWIATQWILDSLPKVVAVILLLLLGAWLIVAGVWMLGELVHMLLIAFVKHSIGLVEFVERRTADGGVGILGFTLLCVGFLLQLAGTIAGANIPTAP